VITGARDKAHVEVIRLGVGLSLALVAAALIVAAVADARRGSAAAPNASKVSGPITHPERDFAGSEVAKHEGGPIPLLGARPGLPGLDVSGWQGNVNWGSVKSHGARFAYIKATEGTGYRSPYFSQQYVGSRRVGLVRGAYHFALPDRSSGAAQANFFAANGGAWSADDQTLPGAIDIEYNPYGPTCYGRSQGSMVAWLRDFINRYRERTGRWAAIYTTTDWWKRCTGNYGGFGDHNPLWIARWSSTVGELPAGWDTYTFWQWASQPGLFPGDQDVFNGSLDRLRVLANDTSVRVVNILDGNTIRVRSDGRRRTVRLLGTDTPAAAGECGGAQATASLRRLLEPGDPVSLVRDPGQARRDESGRRLRYVDAGSVDVGRRQVRRGWGAVLTAEHPFRRLHAYRQAQRHARDHIRGAWGSCDGDFHRAL
jgi:GH25 family lysozyme M1 (1,4-beta-N-acetylmuramidase)